MHSAGQKGFSSFLFLGLFGCLVLFILAQGVARAQWPSDPSTNLPICDAAGSQYGPKLIKATDGYIVVWQDERRVYRDIYAQKFDVNGNIKWADNGRVIAAGNNGETSNHLVHNSQSLTDMVSDTQGGAIALWTEDYSCSSGPCGNAWITRIHSNGDVHWGAAPTPGATIQGTDTAVLLNGHAHADAIAPDGEGGAFVIFGVNAWGSWFVFRLDANGAQRSATADVVGARSGARMIYGGNSNGKDYVNIAWWDYGDFAINIKDPEVDYPASTDTLDAPWNRITLTTTEAWWSEPSLTSDGAGGMIVVWEDSRNGNSDIFAQKIDAGGSAQWTPTGVPIAVQPGRQRYHQLVSDGAGGAVVVWEDSRASPTRIYAQHVGADGSTLWAADGIPISSTYGESPKIIRSDNGTYIIVWVDTDHNGGTRDYLRAQKIDTAGSLLWPADSRTPSGGTTGVVISEIYSTDFDIASDGGRGFIVVWELGGDIHAKRVAPTIGYNPAGLSFLATYGNTNPSGQTLNISNTGYDRLEWSVGAGNAPWLSLYPSSGVNSGTVTVSVNISGLLPGTYNASLTITGLGTTNGPVTIPITLTIGPFTDGSPHSPLLYGDFGPSGIQMWNGITWNQLTSSDPENIVASGSLLYADFGSAGTWMWNDSYWSKLTSSNPTKMVASGSLLYVDFYPYGTWLYNGSNWSKLTSSHPENMVASGSLLYADFGSDGTWMYNGSYWSKLTSSNPTKMVVAGSLLYADFNPYGIWLWNGSNWGQLTASNPEHMVASGSLLYADFGISGGLWLYNGSNWGQLTASNPEHMVASGSLLYAEFGISGGLWLYNGSSWSKLTSSNPETMLAP
jgi:hypothetical protein